MSVILFYSSLTRRPIKRLFREERMRRTCQNVGQGIRRRKRNNDDEEDGPLRHPPRRGARKKRTYRRDVTYSEMTVADNPLEKVISSRRYYANFVAVVPSSEVGDVGRKWRGNESGARAILSRDYHVTLIESDGDGRVLQKMGINGKTELERERAMRIRYEERETRSVE